MGINNLSCAERYCESVKNPIAAKIKEKAPWRNYKKNSAT